MARFDNESPLGVLNFTSVDAIEPGVPYLVQPTIDAVNIITLNTTVSASVITDEGESYDYVGIYAPTVIAEDDYYVAAGNTLKHNTAQSPMKAFRAYFRGKGAGVKALSAFTVDNEPTGVITMDGNSYEGTNVFNLIGQKMNPTSLPSGIYLIGGKKVVIK